MYSVGLGRRNDSDHGPGKQEIFWVQSHVVILYSTNDSIWRDFDEFPSLSDFRILKEDQYVSPFYYLFFQGRERR